MVDAFVEARILGEMVVGYKHLPRNQLDRRSLGTSVGGGREKEFWFACVKSSLEQIDLGAHK